jgi:hypothetical protein
MTHATFSQARDAEPRVRPTDPVPGQIATHLRQDADAHEAELFDAIGRRFDDVERRFPRGTSPDLGRLRVALTFWDGWIDARNNGWPRGPIARHAWPELARGVANDLEADREIGEALVLTCFDLAANPRLNDRVQSLAARLRDR